MALNYKLPLNSHHIICNSNKINHRLGCGAAIDLMTIPIEIKTKGDGSMRLLFFADQEAEKVAGGVIIDIKSSPTYQLAMCTTVTSFSNELPAAEEKVWRISLTRRPFPRIVIHCNDVEVLDFSFADSTCSLSIQHPSIQWRQYWADEVVAKIRFDKTDTVSQFFRSSGNLIKGLSISYCHYSYEFSIARTMNVKFANFYRSIRPQSHTQIHQIVPVKKFFRKIF